MKCREVFSRELRHHALPTLSTARAASAVEERCSSACSSQSIGGLCNPLAGTRKQNAWQG
eukprot:6743924-Alexandrium_andersonii.AAC.1